MNPQKSEHVSPLTGMGQCRKAGEGANGPQWLRPHRGQHRRRTGASLDGEGDIIPHEVRLIMIRGYIDVLFLF